MKTTITGGSGADKPSQTPSKEAESTASVDYEFVDDKGRKLKLKRPSVLAEIEFPLILGQEASANTIYLSRVIPLLYLDSIDGEKIQPFKSALDVQYLIQKLDHEGMDALTLACIEYFSTNATQSKVQEKLKKLSGTLS